MYDVKFLIFNSKLSSELVLILNTAKSKTTVKFFSIYFLEYTYSDTLPSRTLSTFSWIFVIITPFIYSTFDLSNLPSISFVYNSVSLKDQITSS